MLGRMSDQIAPWRKYDPWPQVATHADRVAWCARRFQGWRAAAFRFSEPKRWREGVAHGYIALRTNEGLLLVGSVKAWAGPNEERVQATFTNATLYPNVRYGRYQDNQGFEWFATEVWLRAAVKISWAKGMVSLYAWLSSREELLHGIPWIAQCEGGAADERL